MNKVAVKQPSGHSGCLHANTPGSIPRTVHGLQLEVIRFMKQRQKVFQASEEPQSGCTPLALMPLVKSEWE